MSALNTAHFYARKAQYFGRRVEAIPFLEKSIQNFEIALSQTSNSKAKESIELQKCYYERQLNLLNFKRTHSNRKIDKQRLSDIVISFNQQAEVSTNIQLDLFRNLENTDKLLDQIRKNVPENDAQLQELAQLNAEINLLFYKLYTHNDSLVEENESLREKLQVLQGAKNVDDESSAAQDARRMDEDRNSTPSDDCQDLPPLDFPNFEYK